ncbi:MAG: ABC transporter ATP-binding protein [SAR324 cluster bacterium]|nr:ABC transporter ATP-binding protein [SAR324 cluster bacterium]
MIRSDNLTKFYGTNQALHGLSFRVRRGEIVGLVGKNGAGKSTALKILSGQMLPSAGEVFIDGISVSVDPRAVRARIGYLPEVAPLYREMTVEGYLKFAARLRNVEAGALAAHIEEVTKQTGLSDVIGERLGHLSKGYQQRVGIAQALVHQPPVILLDEPMAGLDPLQIVQIRDLIVSLRKRHTVLFSSHILSEITQVCDRVILIDKGKVRAEGAEAELRRQATRPRQLSLLVRGSEKNLNDALRNVPGLREVSRAKQQQGQWRVRLTVKEDAREKLSKACLEAGLGLLELRGEHDGLEDLFLELLEADPS